MDHVGYELILQRRKQQDSTHSLQKATGGRIWTLSLSRDERLEDILQWNTPDADNC